MNIMNFSQRKAVTLTLVGATIFSGWLAFAQAQSSTGNPLFTVNLSLGSTGTDVEKLQIFLNKQLSEPVAVTGPGSPGQETSYFGVKTLEAVKRFQDQYAVEVLAPVNLIEPTGYVGFYTRKKLNDLATIDDSSAETKENIISADLTRDLNDRDLQRLREEIVFDKWELTEEDKRKIVQSVPAELRSRYFPGYHKDDFTDEPQNILEQKYQELLERQSSVQDILQGILFIEDIKRAPSFLHRSLAVIFGEAKKASAQNFFVFGGRITTTVPCTCNPPAVQVSIAGARPATAIYFPGVTRKSPPGAPTVSASALGNYSNFGVCLVGAPPTCSPIPAVGTIILIGTSY